MPSRVRAHVPGPRWRSCSSGVGLSRLLFGLIRRIRRAALGERAAGSVQERERCDEARYGKMAQSSVLQLKQPSTHAFPDMFRPLRDHPNGSRDAVQIGLQCGGDSGGIP